MNPIGYIYARSHESYDKYDAYKIGITGNIPERDSTYLTSEIIRGKFIFAIVVEVPRQKLRDIEALIQFKFRKLYIYEGGGIEFYKKQIIEHIEPYLCTLNIKYKNLNQQEIDELVKINRPPNKNSNDFVWSEREYQRTIIEYCIEQLFKSHKLYLELATGGGKSYIIYKVISHIKPDIIIILSPRKNINKQNSEDKYLFILENRYSVFNCSENKSFESFKEECDKKNKKIVIVATPREKVYDIIHKYNLSNIFVWFDEAHDTIENWVTKIDKKYTKFFLENNTIIKNRIFTSASPNKKHIEHYTSIFGGLYSPIKVRQLIESQWLCPIKPYVFNLDKTNVSICNYTLENFVKFECKYGFSFHNCRLNASNLFIEHYKQYLNEHTKIKPFLLVGEEYKNSDLDEIILKYDYRNIDTYQKNENSVGYVVKRYNMGYDFNKIDYVIFNDPKMSHSDITQCIGRGLRPDGLGENVKNLNKNLLVMIPVFIKDDEESGFDRIIVVLKYLIHDIGYEFNKINIKFNSRDNKRILGKKYDGNEDMEAILLDLLRSDKKSILKIKEFLNLLKTNNIHDREKSYNTLINNRPELNLPEDPYVFFPSFTWEQTYNKSPYYSKKECIQKIAEIKEEDEDLDLEEEDEPEVYLNKIDPKIPPQCLFRFYGGHTNNEYY